MSTIIITLANCFGKCLCYLIAVLFIAGNCDVAFTGFARTIRFNEGPAIASTLKIVKGARGYMQGGEHSIAMSESALPAS